MNWMVTSTGREHELSGTAATHPDNVPNLEEIGHSLAQTNRYTGHASRPYSVAEHSLLVLTLARNDYASAEVQFAALMHDAHECITNDLASPIKAELGLAWELFEWKHQRHLLEQYELLDVYTQHKARIKHWDLMALATERHQLTRFDKLTNRPWPTLDTQGAEIVNVASLNLNAEWRQTNTWQTWAYVFTRQANELQDRMTLQRHQAAEAKSRARFAA